MVGFKYDKTMVLYSQPETDQSVAREMGKLTMIPPRNLFLYKTDNTNVHLCRIWVFIVRCRGTLISFPRLTLTRFQRCWNPFVDNWEHNVRAGRFMTFGAEIDAMDAAAILISNDTESSTNIYDVSFL